MKKNGTGVNYKRFLVIGEGPAKKAIDDFLEAARLFQEHVGAICDKYGTTKLRAWREGVYGIILDAGQPIPEGWMHKQGDPADCYSPNKRTKAGKAAAKELGKVKQPGFFFLKSVSPAQVVFDSGKLFSPTFEEIGGDFVWGLPVKGEMNADFDTTGLKELKESEYWAMKEAVGQE